MLSLRLGLSKRRQQMADELKQDATAKAADFDYRRRITDDIEVILREADVFKPQGLGDPTALDHYEQDVLLRRLAEDIARYIVQ